MFWHGGVGLSPTRLVSLKHFHFTLTHNEVHLWLMQSWVPLLLLLLFFFLIFGTKLQAWKLENNCY